MTDLEKCRLVLQAAEVEIDRLKSENGKLLKENRWLKSGVKHPVVSILEYLEPAPLPDLATMEVKGSRVN